MGAIRSKAGGSPDQAAHCAHEGRDRSQSPCPQWEAPRGGTALMPVQLTSPSGVAGPRGTPCDVLDDVRRVPAQWVRPLGPRLHPSSMGPQLVSWPGMVPASLGRSELDRH